MRLKMNARMKKLTQLGVGLHEPVKLCRHDEEDSRRRARPAAHERLAVREHAHLAGELSALVHRHGLFDVAARVDNLDLAFENDVHRHIGLTLIEQELAGFEFLLDADPREARYLRLGQSREHLRAPSIQRSQRTERRRERRRHGSIGR